jgi:hypothetical protein
VTPTEAVEANGCWYNRERGTLLTRRETEANKIEPVAEASACKSINHEPDGNRGNFAERPRIRRDSQSKELPELIILTLTNVE